MAKHAFIIRDFRDAGTGQYFSAGSIERNLPAGAFANYEAAGLVRAATDKELQPPAPAKGDKAAH